MLLDSSLERSLDLLDARLLELGADLQFQPAQYPILIGTETLERAGYLAAFPHLLFDATPHESARGMGIPAHEVHATGFHPLFMGKDAHATPTRKQSLSPAVCFHVFSALSSQTLTTPVRVTARGRCFRREETVTPGRRQFEFQMREFILLGEKQLIDPVLWALVKLGPASAQRWLCRANSTAESAAD
jgi:seryl-tRNA synthetase